MNQDKIKQAFEAWLHNKDTKVYGNRAAWLAACEWLMSQGSESVEDALKKTEDYFSKELEICVTVNDASFFRQGYKAARLSCARELAEKDKRIAELEKQVRCGYQHAHNQLIPLCDKCGWSYAELTSKKEG
jgi:uncharacterized protein (DUF2164 family)